jgi:hypothetical protein
MKLNIQNHWYQRLEFGGIDSLYTQYKVHGIWIHIHFHSFSEAFSKQHIRNWHAHTKIMNLHFGNILICIDYYIIIKCHSVDHLVLCRTDVVTNKKA